MTRCDAFLNDNGRTPTQTAVAIDRDKNSLSAVKWAIDNLTLPDKRIILVHIDTHQYEEGHDAENRALSQQLFIPCRGCCARKGIRAKETIIIHTDVAKALSEFITSNSITAIVLGASSRGALARAFGYTDVPTYVAKSAPASCTVYAVSKGKATTMKAATEIISLPIPVSSSKLSQGFSSELRQRSWRREKTHWDGNSQTRRSFDGGKISSSASSISNGPESIVMSPRGRSSFSITSSPPKSTSSSSETLPIFSWENCRGSRNFQFMEPTNSGSDTSWVSSNSSFDIMSAKDGELEQKTPQKRHNRSSVFRKSSEYLNLRGLTFDFLSHFSSASSKHSEELFDENITSNSSTSSTSLQMRDLEEELKRVRLELMQMTGLYNVACREAVTAREKLQDVLVSQSEAAIMLEEAKKAQEAANSVAAREKQKCKVAMKLAVYRAKMDHTPVAIKILRSELAEGQKQFQREVEVLSRIRHPNMVILLGACPDYGCLVYEFMENGTLEDRLYCKDGTPPLPWRARFKIAAEIATALNFLHQMRPEPIVHRDLKPANVLLDKNFSSKISDVGLSRFLPSSMSYTMSQYQITAAVGTFCYIDPEYQQTGTLGTKSDVYSLGILLLQIVTGKSPMGLTYHVEKAIERGRFSDVLDQTAGDWPVEEALNLAKLGLKCSELRRRDRPDLNSVILPELHRLSEL